MDSTSISFTSGQSASGRYYRIAQTKHAVVIWLSPFELDGETYGGDDDLIISSHRPHSLADVEDHVLACVNAVLQK